MARRKLLKNAQVVSAEKRLSLSIDNQLTSSRAEFHARQNYHDLSEDTGPHAMFFSSRMHGRARFWPA